MSENDRDNPEWTEEDFAKAKRPNQFPDWVKEAFPKTRGPQKAPTKQSISIRLSPDVLDYYRSTGRGWQGRIDDDLRKQMKRKRA